VPPVIPVTVSAWEIFRDPRAVPGLSAELACNYAAARRAHGWRPAPVLVGHYGPDTGGRVIHLTARDGSLLADVADLPSHLGARLNARRFTGWSISIENAARFIDGFTWRCSTLGHVALLLPGEVPAVKGMVWPTARFRNGMIVPPSTS
jgi:hypothetical protein